MEVWKDEHLTLNAHEGRAALPVLRVFALARNRVRTEVFLNP